MAVDVDLKTTFQDASKIVTNENLNTLETLFDPFHGTEICEKIPCTICLFFFRRFSKAYVFICSLRKRIRQACGPRSCYRCFRIPESAIHRADSIHHRKDHQQYQHTSRSRQVCSFRSVATDVIHRSFNVIPL